MDKCIRDCNNECFHNFDHICEYDIELTNIGNNEIVIKTISDKSMSLHETNKNLTVARQNGFVYNQIYTFTKKIYGKLSNINIQYSFKLRIPITHRQNFIILSQNKKIYTNTM